MTRHPASTPWPVSRATLGSATRGDVPTQTYGARASRIAPRLLTAARFANLLLVATLAGLFVGVLIVEQALLEVPGEVYTAVQKPKHEAFAPVMPVFVFLTIASGLAVLVLLAPYRRTVVFGLTVVGLLCIVALTVTTLVVNVPINTAIIDTWSPAGPPPDWARTRDRWNLFHLIRTVLAVFALACLLLAALLPQPRWRGEPPAAAAQGRQLIA